MSDSANILLPFIFTFIKGYDKLLGQGDPIPPCLLDKQNDVDSIGLTLEATESP